VIDILCERLIRPSDVRRNPYNVQQKRETSRMARRSVDPESKPGRISRRSLITTSAGVATTAALTAASPAAAAVIGLHETPAVPLATPTTPIPAHPVVAYVHDAARGEVTIVSGPGERTFRDAALVKRLLAAAQSPSMPGTGAK
jgi:hypothetical protein